MELSLSALALVSISFLVSLSSAARPPNIVVMFADDFGYADLASFGHATQERGALDEMATEGIRFTHWYSADSLCTPSRAALLTGRLPVRSGMVPEGQSNARVLSPDDSGGLPDEELTIAEALSGHGYATGMVGKWHLGINKFNATDGLHLPNHHGFQFVGTILPFSNHWACDESGRHMKSPSPKTCFLYRNNTIVQQPIRHHNLTATLVQEAKQFIQDNQQRPFFLYMPFAHCHVSMFSSGEFTNSSRRGIYGDNVREMDWAVGEILETLKQNSLANNTIVFFTSDNGPHIELCLEGGSAGLLTGGKSQTWEGGIRMPAIAWWPGTIEAGRVSRSLASTMDIFATALDLAGVEPPEKLVLDGRSLKSLLLNTNNSSPHEFLFHYCSSRLMAVRHGPFKVHFVTQRLANVTMAGYSNTDCVQGSPKGEIFAGWGCFGTTTTEHNPPLIFNIDNDPSEEYPLLADEYEELLSAISAAVSKHKAGMSPGTPQLGHRNASLQPCCNPPKCTCNI